MKNPFLLVLLSGLAAACGSSASDAAKPVVETTPPLPVDPAPAAAAPTSAPPGPDNGTPSEKYPAFVPAMAQITSSGGPVLKNPVIVTVTWPGEPKAAELETFGDTVGASQYWKDVTSEYGASAGVSGDTNHVRLTSAPPASMSDAELDAFVASSLGAADTTWPTPATGDPVYILYLSSATSLLLDGKSACSQGVGGYHASTVVNGKNVAYAIVPNCTGQPFDLLTLSASHELAEATTDPYPDVLPAWQGFRVQDLAWEFFQEFQDENGDACEFYRDSDLAAGESDIAFTVQRQWSNKSAAAGHDPCVPAFKNTKYFNVTPLDLENIDVDLSSLGPGAPSSVVTKGIKIPVGSTKTFSLGFYSDGPLDAWTIKAVEGGITGGQKGHVDLSLDVAEGKNGQKANLTATVNSAGKTNSELIMIVSTRAGTSHYMPILVGNK